MQAQDLRASEGKLCITTGDWSAHMEGFFFGKCLLWSLCTCFYQGHAQSDASSSTYVMLLWREREGTVKAIYFTVAIMYHSHA